MATSCVFGVSIGARSHTTTIASQTARFGPLPTVRQFFTGMPGNVPAGLTTAMTWDVSFKCSASDYVGLVGGTYTTALVAWLRSLPAAQKVKARYYHEPEDNGFTFAQWKAAAGFWNNLVHTTSGIVADVEAWQCYMVGTMLGWNGRNINNYWDDTWDANHRPDGIGFDIDGPIVTVSGSTYPDIGPWVSLCQTFAASKGIPWDVPEFGGDPLTRDTTHAGRAAWITASAQKIAAGGAQSATYWDDDAVYLSQTVEIAAWKALVGQAPATIPDPPTGITVTPATDGLSAAVGWAVLPAGVDHLDAFIQGPGQTYPHKLNTTPIPVTPRTWSFPTLVGTTYDPGVTLAAAATPDGTVRSGYSTFAGFQTPKPGATNHAPAITSTTLTPDPANPLLWHVAAVCVDPDGDLMSYDWKFTNPADPGKPALHVLTASGDVLFTSDGRRDWTFTVTDSGGLPTPKSGSISVTLTDSATTAYASLRMLQPGENLQQMGPIERESKPRIDAALRKNAYRRSAHNRKHHLVASTFDPNMCHGSQYLEPTASNFLFAYMTMEGDILAHLAASTTQKQIGTGALAGIFDETGNLDLSGSFSADGWLQKTEGNIDMDLAAALRGYDPGYDVIGVGIWWPPTGITRYPRLRVSSAGGIQNSFGPPPNVLWGVVNSVATFPAAIPFGSALTIQCPLLAVPEP